MTTFFILVFLLYSTLLLLLTWGWMRLSRNKKPEPGQITQRSISVIIPFRNEVAFISSMLRNLNVQSYGKDKFEIILIDDHSTDRSAELVEKEKEGNIVFIQLPSELSGKKAALDLGIRVAKGEIIAISDMDCHLPEHWLMKINEGLQSENIKMLVGAVRIEASQSLFSKLQSLEFSSLIGTSGGTLGWGRPTMCNGANLAFLRSAYETVNGYEGNSTIPSGDDEFLMRKIAARWKNSISFLFDQDTVVATAAQSSFESFIHQRLRWGSKWKHNSSIFTQAVAIGVLNFHVCFLLFFLAIVSGKIDLKDGLILWSVKMITEAIFLFNVTSFLRLRWSWLSFLTLQFTHSFYVVSIGIFSQVKSYHWKGRQWSPVKSG